MKTIIINTGKQTLLDDDTYNYANQWKWYEVSGYARREYRIFNKTYRVALHHVVLGIVGEATGTLEVDHVNGNRLDNRKENLRIVHKAENQRNAGLRSDNTSGYKGVTLDKQTGHWKAQCYRRNKRIHIGSFNTAKEAALAYNKVASKEFGVYARLNKIN